MAYLFGLLVIALFFWVIHFYTELDTKQKIGATVAAGSVVMGAIFFNYLQAQKSAHVGKVMRRFDQGKIVECGDISVSNKSFSLSIGTQTFIGLKNSPHGEVMLTASECE